MAKAITDIIATLIIFISLCAIVCAGTFWIVVVYEVVEKLAKTVSHRVRKGMENRGH